MHDGKEFGRVAADLLPPGTFWDGFRAADGRGRAMLNAKGDSIAARRDADDALLRETYPPSTVAMIGDWEEVCGLPDACTFGDLTLSERRAQVVQRLIARGGQSLAFFRGIAEALGYTVTLREYFPFRCGVNRCGDELVPPSLLHHWVCEVHGARFVPFRVGVSQCGDPLGLYRPAYDLECVMRRARPAQTTLHFVYGEA